MCLARKQRPTADHDQRFEPTGERRLQPVSVSEGSGWRRFSGMSTVGDNMSRQRYGPLMMVSWQASRRLK